VIVHKDALTHLGEGISENSSRPVNACIKLVFSIFSLFHREYKYHPLTVNTEDLIISSDDSNTLRRIGVAGDILHTPGHTLDSISVILDDGKTFVGDAAMNFLNFCQIRYRPIYAQDIDMVYKSWKKLIDYGAKYVYPAHGKPFPVEEMVSSYHYFINSF
jgi:glyoxylase-like metal-dependent hydrolase (beta-lactamase superfamily II)